MDVGRVASLFIHGSEASIAGKDMYLRVELARPVDQAAARAAYERMVQEHDPLRSDFVKDDEAASYRWRRLDDEELSARLEVELERMESPSEDVELSSVYVPTNEGLPFRVLIPGPQRLVFCISHVVANGRAVLAWTARWFDYYSREIGAEHRAETLPPVRKRPLVWRIGAGLRGIWAVLAYLVGFFARAGGKRAAAATVDLSSGATPRLGVCDFQVTSRTFDQDETARITSAARGANMSLGEFICGHAADAFFAAQPTRDRVCMSMPVDLRHEVPVDVLAAGNYTGSLIMQVHRSRDLPRQIRASFRWFRRRVPLWLTRLVGVLSRDEGKLFAHFEAQAKKTIPERAPLENFTFAFSNVGVVREKIIAEYALSLSGHTRTQTVFLAALTVNGRLSMEASYPRTLYDPAVVEPVLARLFEALAQARPVPSRPSEALEPPVEVAHAAAS
jgi:hypothetical protein